MKLSSLRRGAKVLRTKWVYADQKDENGFIVRFKARLTACGNFQRAGIDYFETFASVMRTKTFRVLLQLWNSSSDHEMEHWDIKAAFINAPIEEDIWINQRNGHEVPDTEKMVYKLDKAIYGCKQSARAWMLFLQGMLRKAGFSPLRKDEAVYVKRSSDVGATLVLTLMICL